MTKNYLQHIKAQGNSSQTSINYARYLDRFIYETNINSIEEINTKLINDFIIKMQEKKYKNQTINYILTAVRCWLKYEIKTNNANVMSPKMIDNLKFDRPKIDIDAKDILQKLSATKFSKRDTMVINLFLSTGLRLSELKSILIQDIRNNNNQISITVRGKGGKLRLVFISDEVYILLQQYIGSRKDGELFSENIKTLYRIIKNAGVKIGCNLYPHKLRHIFATDMLQNGAPIQSVQHILGHSSITTTEMYSHISNNTLYNAFKKYHQKSNTITNN